MAIKKFGTREERDVIEQQLRQAYVTLSRLPDPDSHYRKALGSSWSFPIRRKVFHDNLQKNSAPVRVPATAHDIQQMDQAFRWLGHLASRERKIVGTVSLLMAFGRKNVPWQHVGVATRMMVHEDTLRRCYYRGLGQIIVCAYPFAFRAERRTP